MFRDLTLRDIQGLELSTTTHKFLGYIKGKYD